MYTAEDLLHQAVTQQTLPVLVQCLLFIMSAFVADRPLALRRLAATLVCQRKLNAHHVQWTELSLRGGHRALPIFIDAFDPRHRLVGLKYLSVFDFCRFCFYCVRLFFQLFHPQIFVLCFLSVFWIVYRAATHIHAQYFCRFLFETLVFINNDKHSFLSFFLSWTLSASHQSCIYNMHCLQEICIWKIYRCTPADDSYYIVSDSTVYGITPWTFLKRRKQRLYLLIDCTVFVLKSHYGTEISPSESNIPSLRQGRFLTFVADQHAGRWPGIQKKKKKRFWEHFIN